MSKKKKRPLAPPPLKSLKRARQVTSAFHSATRQLDDAIARGDSQAAATAREAVEAVGGREAYQAASAAATGRHKVASRFVWSHLTRLGFREKKTSAKEKEKQLPRLLEIGAINTQLLQTPWLQVRSVDLRAPPSSASSSSGVASPNDKKRKRIEAIDFFDTSKLPQENSFNVVVCSMVLNCLTTPGQRGEMLRGIRRHLRFEEEEGDGDDEEEEEESAAAVEAEEARRESKRGLAFIMLPRRCVEASRACDWSRFERCMARAGLGEVLARKASAKVAFWLVRATAIPSPSSSSHSASASDDGDEENSALIAAAHAAGEFAVSMTEVTGTGGGGGKNERMKEKKGS